MPLPLEHFERAFQFFTQAFKHSLLSVNDESFKAIFQAAKVAKIPEAANSNTDYSICL
jgi:hypothetical protein